jgi:endoglucanase
MKKAFAFQCKGPHLWCYGRLCFLALSFTAVFRAATVVQGAGLVFTGVNLSGAEFGVGPGTIWPGTYNTNYTYPTAAEVDYFVGKGMNTFRLPFRWERLQQSLNGALDSAELARMNTFVNYATSKGAYVIVDPHNFQRYKPDLNNFQSSAQGLVGSAVPDSAFADFWTRIANTYKTNTHVIFNLMNEPNSVPETQLVTSENAAIAAIRAAGAKNLILVPGNRYTGAWTWNNSDSNGASNASAMLNIVDSGNNFAFDVHQYFDSDGSGSHSTINNNDVNVGVSRLTAFTQWLNANNRRGFLGEFAAANSIIGTGGAQIGDEVLNNTLNYIQANSNVWLGWAWWGGGPWWGSYMFALDPSGNTDQPSMGVLQSHFAVAPKAGDFNRDGIITAADVSAMLKALTNLPSYQATQNLSNLQMQILGDVNGDFQVTNSDIQSLINLVATNALGVPEPTVLCLLIIGLLCLAAASLRLMPLET